MSTPFPAFMPDENGRCMCAACALIDSAIVIAPEEIEPPLTAEDVRTARLDTDAHGRVFDEVKIAAAVQVLRSIAKEQPTASAVIKALAEATLERIAK